MYYWCETGKVAFLGPINESSEETAQDVLFKDVGQTTAVFLDVTRIQNSTLSS